MEQGTANQAQKFISDYEYKTGRCMDASVMKVKNMMQI